MYVHECRRKEAVTTPINQTLIMNNCNFLQTSDLDDILFCVSVSLLVEKEVVGEVVGEVVK